MSERCIHLNWLKQLRLTSLCQGSVLKYKTSGTLPGTVSSLRYPHFVCGSSCQDKEDFRELCFTSSVELRLCILRTPWNFSGTLVWIPTCACQGYPQHRAASSHGFGISQLKHRSLTLDLPRPQKPCRTIVLGQWSTYMWGV